jgi:energy-coupling factor transport system ATP-binding protein
VIQCEGLTFAHPDGTRALDGIDLEIGTGERVSITGRNGSGKTTLVRHWNGLLRATGGRVVVDGSPIDRRRVAELARTVGLVFQDPDDQIFASTCRAEVAFGPRNLGLLGAELDDAVDGALAAVGLDEAGRTNPYDLGRARRKLLAIASVVAMRTPVVVIDEPTAGQDARGITRLREIVASLASEGRTVVVISHDMRFIADTCEREIRLDAGRVVADGPPSTLPASPSRP